MSKKRTTAAVLVSAAWIAGLILLGIGITALWQDSEDFAGSLLENPVESVLEDLAEENAAVTSSEDSKTESPADGSSDHLIWVGDSRTLGMKDALRGQTEDIFIGAAGEGYDWLSTEGVTALGEAILENPGSPVIMNMGVNDYVNISLYLSLYEELEREYPDTGFYYLSVNPVDDEADLSATNENICEFNNQIRSSCPDRYIDSFTYLTEQGIETNDGLHYSAENYQILYQFVKDAMDDRLEPAG